MRDTWLILAIIAIVMLLIISAKHDKSRIKEGALLPKGATNIIEVGEDWFEFTYKGKRFLYHRTGIADNRMECLAQISEK